MEKIKKYKWYLIGVIALLLLAGTCTTQYVSKKEGEKAQLELQLKALKAQVMESEEKRIAQKDSLQKENDSLDSEIKELHKNNITLKNKIIAAKEQTKQEREKVKNYNFEQLAGWLATKYKLPESVSSNDTSVTMSGTLPAKVVDDLIVKDELSSTVESQKQELKNKDEEISDKDKKLLNKDLEIASGEASINLMKETQKTSDDLDTTNNKIIKGLKTKTIIGGISGIAIGIITGILISK